MTAGREVKETIVEKNPNAKIDVMELDLSSMASVRKFAAVSNPPVFLSKSSCKCNRITDSLSPLLQVYLQYMHCFF